MTNEEKAKAYDEALEDMRVIYPNLKGDAKLAVEHAFPQLRESEDERIRKEMIAYFAHRADVTEFIDEGEDCKRWISYLEKQKEQKPIDYPYLPGWRKNRDNNKPELKRSVLMLTTHGVAEGEWLGEKWCQYRWSCELKDGEVLYWIHLSDLEWLGKEGEEKQKEQKPTATINGEPVSAENHSVDIPLAEWSEEDENVLKYLHDLISWGYAEKFMDAQTAHDMRVWINERLRHDTFQNGNSRPKSSDNWKPSEEHLSALLAVFNDPDNIGSQTCQLALTDLYEQLKKL